MITPMPTQAELTAIIEAGKRATPRPYRIAVTENEPGRFGKVLLAEEKPNGTSTVIADMVPGRKGANGDYLVLAANHADIHAATLQRFQWQPIETAPKDGTHLLLYRYSNGGACVGEAWWGQNCFGEWCWGGNSWNYPEWSQPTHWMHLPESPTP